MTRFAFRFRFGCHRTSNRLAQKSCPWVTFHQVHRDYGNALRYVYKLHVCWHLCVPSLPLSLSLSPRPPTLKVKPPFIDCRALFPPFSSRFPSSRSRFYPRVRPFCQFHAFFAQSYVISPRESKFARQSLRYVRIYFSDVQRWFFQIFQRCRWYRR